ncbi:MAG TPA: hypothetical protein VEY07_06535 [Thermoplasmata archaeon]|nr:hypothetical protein [Thermoplasmata archaeon]
MSAGYATPPVTSLPASRYRPPSASTAESLVLVALILQVIGGVIGLGGIAYLFGFSLLYPFPYAWAAVTAAAAVAVVVIAFLYLAYTLSYQRIQRGEYQEAQAPTLVIGILSLFAGILPGIFYILGYVKLGDAIREQGGYGYGYPLPPPPTTPASIACRACGRVSPMGQFAFCPGCGQRLGA